MSKAMVKTGGVFAKALFWTLFTVILFVTIHTLAETMTGFASTGQLLFGSATGLIIIAIIVSGHIFAGAYISYHDSKKQSPSDRIGLSITGARLSSLRKNLRQKPLGLTILFIYALIALFSITMIVTTYLITFIGSIDGGPMITFIPMVPLAYGAGLFGVALMAKSAFFPKEQLSQKT